MCGRDDDPTQHDRDLPRPRTFVFEGRPHRADILAAVKAALDDEGLAYSGGSWGRVAITINGDGQLVAVVPSNAISPRSTPA